MIASQAQPININGTQVFLSEDETTAFYLPDAPAPECNDHGEPTLTVLRTPQSVILQLGTHFGLTAQQLAELQVKLAAKNPKLARARLQPAPITVAKAAVLLAGPNGALSEIRSATSSGFPPYACIFAATLSAEQGALAISAVEGRTGVLFVDYTLTRHGASAPQSFRTDVGTWFATGKGSAHVY